MRLLQQRGVYFLLAAFLICLAGKPAAVFSYALIFWVIISRNPEIAALALLGVFLLVMLYKWAGRPKQGKQPEPFQDE